MPNSIGGRNDPTKIRIDRLCSDVDHVSDFQRPEKLQRYALNITIVDLEDERMATGVQLTDQSTVPIFALGWTGAVVAHMERFLVS